MSKREASQIAVAGIDIDAPRAKRRREAPSAEAGAPTKEQGGATSVKLTIKKEGDALETVTEDPEVVKEKGLKVWQMVKDAVNKEGRSLSNDFLRLPSKRQYPDYYQQIKRPVSLEEIKTQLDTSAYTSLEDLKQDFETCFRNAKRYNIKESQIWKDAKHLHKLVLKEYSKITGTPEDALADAGDDVEEHAGAPAGGSDDEGGKKKKAPNMIRLLKARLQKLIEKTDDSGRMLSTEFMDLPNRKQWAIYYKTIKRPQCLENIFKRLKRKEYHTASDFANDVELVFSNALEFNQDHTGIWEDALVLRDYFRQIMSDLPAPYTLPAYSSPAAKIRFKMPTTAAQSSAQQPSAALATSPPANGSPSSGTVRIPAQHAPAPNGATALEASKSPVLAPIPSKVVPASANVLSQPTQPVVSSTAPPTPVPVTLQLKPIAPTANAQPASFIQPAYTTAYTHYSNTVYNHSPAQPMVAGPSSAIAPLAVSQSHTPTAPSTATSLQPTSTPDVSSHRQLRCAILVTKPLGRRLELDQSDGVKTWAVRLQGESGVRIFGVSVQEEHDDQEDVESSSDEKGHEQEEQEEEQQPKAKQKRGRPRKKQKAADTLKPTEGAKGKNKSRISTKAASPQEEVQLKLNGVFVKGIDEAQEWDLELPVGSNIIELAEKGGVPWRVYLDRLSF
ncbi:uncharacterized protein FIBRA_00126 [Fibroporia radiculosa]|uniref:Bromo domain-containing protein n=1 Tax=Fibroporia radiculosa TaxID=599839 RepID=J7RGA3_9APHY|nr:uncharacterized protein FIBRA_00126 [Fibroporia radiculosa]CCL98132.1 predicted protein [Fibroporia radiculosa]